MIEQNRSYLRRTRIAALACAVLVSLSACGGQGAAQVSADVAEEETAIPVQVQMPEIGSLTQTTEFIGTVEPDELVSVLPKASGTVLRVYKNVGDVVKKDELLFEIDPIDIELSLAAQKAAVDVAQAAVVQAQATVDQSLGSGYDINVAQLEAQVQQAKQSYSTARQNLRDYNDSTDDNVDYIAKKIEKLESQQLTYSGKLKDLKAERDEMSTSDPDWTDIQEEIAKVSSQLGTIETELSLARANYNEIDDGDSSTRKNLRTAVSNAQLAYDSSNTIYELTKGSAYADALKVANASLGQATAAFEAQVKSYEAAAQQLAYTKVYSPIDGVIEECNVTENGMATNSNPAYTVSNKTNLTATFYVSSNAVSQMNVGDEVTIENGQRQYHGRLTEVGTMTDASSGLFKVKAVIQDAAPGEIMTGVSVKISAVTAKTEGSILVPQSCLYYEDEKGYVYVNDNGRAVKTYVETGITNNEYAEIVSGLSQTSQIITTWNPNLINGALLAIQGAAEAPAADSSSEASASSQAGALDSEETASTPETAGASSASSADSAASDSDANKDAQEAKE